MARVRVENFAGLVRDTNSNAIINVNKSDKYSKTRIV